MNEIEQQVWNQFTDQLKIPVWKQIKNQVYNQNKMREIIINRFQRQIETQVKIQVNKLK